MRRGREWRPVRHSGDRVALNDINAVAAPNLARIAVDLVFHGRRIDAVNIGPLTDEALRVDRLHSRVGIAMPDRHARPWTAMRRRAPHLVAPHLRDVRFSLKHALERLL